MTFTADRTPRELLDSAEDALRARRRAEVDDLLVALAWADLHGGPPATDVPGGDRLVRLGGDGTPKVRDLCLEELSVARQAHVASTRAAMADALDLRHRLPKVWAAVQELVCEPWVARKVARMSRDLARDKVALVDTAVAAALHQAPSRVLAIAEAKVIEADTAAHEADLAARGRERGVWLGRTTPADPEDPTSGRGSRSLFAKLAAEDALWVDTMIDEVADLLADSPALRAQHHPDLGDDPTRDQLRAAAFGWVARPTELSELLTHGSTSDQTEHRRQRSVVYIHLSEAALEAGSGVARAEALGPVLVQRLAELLGHAHIDLKPVIDLNTGASVNGYEHPTAMKERTFLRSLGDVFPHAAGLGRRVDIDHAVPYDRDGPPGQTSDANAAPLARRSHRAKTHGRYTVEQLGLASYLWTTPHGLIRLVTPDGTRPLGELRVELHRAYRAA